MAKIRRGQKARVWRKQCLSLDLNNTQKGPGVRFTHCPWQCSFCVSLDRYWSSWEKSPSLLLLRSEGVKSSSLPTKWRLGCLICVVGRGKVEIARILVFCSSALQPTVGFIPLGNAAVPVWASNESCRGLAVVLTSRITSRSWLGAICCLVWNVGIQPMWRISRGRLGKSPSRVPWGNGISYLVTVTRVSTWSPSSEPESTCDLLHSPTIWRQLLYKDLKCNDIWGEGVWGERGRLEV